MPVTGSLRLTNPDIAEALRIELQCILHGTRFRRIWPARKPCPALLQAIDLHRDGDLEQAERLYKRALDADQQCADAHHMLGALMILRYGKDEVSCNILAYNLSQ
jgi:hypothetical protein